MRIKIEIDVEPEELRTFLGLPDVAGLQEDTLRYIRDRVSQGAEGFDPAALLRETTLGGARAWQRLFTAAFDRAQSSAADDADDAGEASAQEESTPRREGAAGAGGRTGNHQRDRTGTARKPRSRTSAGRTPQDSDED